MLICEQVVPFEDFKVLVSGKSEFYLKIKKKIILLEEPINRNMEHLCHYICLISYTNILQSCITIYLFSSFIHCYLLFAVITSKIHDPVRFKKLY